MSKAWLHLLLVAVGALVVGGAVAALIPAPVEATSPGAPPSATGGADAVGALGTVGTASATNDTEDGPTEDPGEEQYPYLTCGNGHTNYSTVSESGPYDLSNANETVFSLRSEQDGARIQVALVRPNTTERVPVIVRATPYVDDLRNDDISECGGTARLVHNYVQHGYAVATVSVRGTGGSGGCFDQRGPRERRDLNQTVTYLGEADWSTGRVGMIGGSYDGTTALAVAGMGNPHLKTVVPMGSVPDPHEQLYGEGAVELRGPGYLFTLYQKDAILMGSPVYGTSPAAFAERFSCPDRYARAYAASGYATYTGEEDPTGYWAARNLKPLVERNYEGSVFLVHGFRDKRVTPSQVYPWAERLEADPDIEVRYMLGQWGHVYPDQSDWAAGTRRTDWADIMLRWWDRELKGQDVDVGPDAYVQDSTGEWRFESTWPPERTRNETWYLQSGGDLSRQRTDTTGTQVVAVDPDRHQANPFHGGNGPAPSYEQDLTPGCRVCARFATTPFEHPYRFAGAPTVNVSVTPTGPYGYVAAEVFVVNESGHATQVGYGMTDLRHADDDGERETVIPGQRLTVTVPVQPNDVTVPAGSRLVVVLHQGTVNRQSGSPPAPVVVHAGAGQSTLDVPTFDASGNPAAAPGSPGGSSDDA